MIASELRIGNLILHGTRIHEIAALLTNNEYYDSLSAITHTERDLNDCVGIPLTEEWLIKFGFEKMPWDMRFRSEYYSKKYESDFKLSERVDLVFRKDKNVFAFNMAGLHIKHVHQLQNLYFALTGEELTIKE